MRKCILFLSAVLLSIALSGCSGNAGSTGTDNIPEVPLEKLTNEFRNGIYQEVEPDSRKVINFDTKENWIEHMTEIMDKDLARKYADDFFYEENGDLYLISRGGPPVLLLDKPYDMKTIDDRKVQVKQINKENMMFGEYELTVTYEYRDGRWVICDREFNILENGEELLSPDEAAEIISQRADEVLNLIANKNMKALIGYIHPDKGVRFSPYTFVDLTNDVLLMPSELDGFFSEQSEYCWGSYDGTGEAISLTPAAYYDVFIYDQDYRNADKVSYNKQLFNGNMLNNAHDVYPGSIIVEYHFDGFDAKYGGMDWRSLRLVYEEYKGEWLLVGCIHDQWTI